MNIIKIIPLYRFLLKTHRKLTNLLNKRQCSSKKKKQTCSTPDLHICKINECMIDPCSPEPSVVIIGAGISGLSAAQRLMQCGISNFTLLEATDRPGGRIHSCWLGDVIAEMGCMAIHGACCNNPVYNLAAQENLIKKPGKPKKTRYCTSDGRAIDSTTTIMAEHVFNGIREEAMGLFNMRCGKEHGSLKNFLYLRIQQELQKFPEERRYDVSRVLFGLTNKMRYPVGEDLGSVSADNIGSRISIPGGVLKIPFGFIGVLSPLLRELPDCSLKFNKPVNLIKWGAVQPKSKSPRAIVQCCDGEEFCADYVLLTVSLGVLKEHADRLFCPGLPANKMTAIRTMGFGNADKIFLEYDRPFWAWSNGNMELAWSQDELANRTDWTKGISFIEEVEGSKHLLCAFISGPEAVVMEHATDEEVADGITKVLRQFTGDPSLPYPSTVLRSKWTSDPYFCGAFTYIHLNSSIGHLCELSCPVPGPCDAIPPILLFAGDATCAGHYSTVHGARLSGIREAERIIQLTKQFGGPPPKECS